jgi:hypothetical protein
LLDVVGDVGEVLGVHPVFLERTEARLDLAHVAFLLVLFLSPVREAAPAQDAGDCAFAGGDLAELF